VRGEERLVGGEVLVFGWGEEGVQCGRIVVVGRVLGEDVEGVCVDLCAC